MLSSLFLLIFSFIIIYVTQRNSQQTTYFFSGELLVYFFGIQIGLPTGKMTLPAIVFNTIAAAA